MKSKLGCMEGLVLGALVGCGPTAADLVGTWTLQDGSINTTSCESDGEVVTSYWDGSGDSLEFLEGAEHDLITHYDGDCYEAFSFADGELHSVGYEGTGCPPDEETLPEGASSAGEIYFVYSVEGETALLKATGSITLTTSSTSCVITSAIVLARPQS